jgi:hypothetical protein
MDNPLEMLLPLAGFVGGLLLWSRVAHISIALSGLTPNPAKPRDDLAALGKAYRRLVLRIAVAWMIFVGALLVYMLHHGRTGFAFLFAGIEAVPLLTVPMFVITVRRINLRKVPSKSQISD